MKTARLLRVKLIVGHVYMTWYESDFPCDPYLK